MATSDNLQSAFAGESQANRKYLAFAKKADSEGHVQIAKLFRAAAEAETIHAHAHLRAMNGVKTTAENLQEAVSGEEFEFKNMYPGFVEEAEKEGDKTALLSFKNAMAVEQVHYSLYLSSLEKLKKGEEVPDMPIHVCNVCGNTVLGDAPDKCAVCNAGKQAFTEVK